MIDTLLFVATFIDLDDSLLMISVSKILQND